MQKENNKACSPLLLQARACASTQFVVSTTKDEFILGYSASLTAQYYVPKTE